MASYTYSAVDARGKGTRGTLQAADQSEALQRIKEMGFFPTKVSELTEPQGPAARASRHLARLSLTSRAATGPAINPRLHVGHRRLTVFTRQLATLLEAGMPLLRGLRLLQEQETCRVLKEVIIGLAAAIEGGSSFSEALAQFPKVFDRLYLNLVKSGEMCGALDSSLKRLATFMENSQRIKGRVKAALFYPAAVGTVALGVIALMLIYIVPKFQTAIQELDPGHTFPAFSRFVFGVSAATKDNFLIVAAAMAGLSVAFLLAIRTRAGREGFDWLKLRLPSVGPVCRKLAVARVARTLGTLLTSGVPILQALTIVREAAGNVIVGRLVGRVHESVEQGESIAGPLRGSGIFPALVVGMIDVGEQTGSLPEMLNKIADNYDEETNNSVTAMTSLLEPILIVLLGIVVGCIVIALFMAIFSIVFRSDANI